MAEVVDNGLKRLHKEDASALATYYCGFATDS
jgi:hypothetical protein